MKSIIYWYMDKQWQEKVAIGNSKHFNNVMKSTARQLIRIVYIEHDDEFRQWLSELPQQELYATLLWIWNSSLYKYYPN